MKDAHRSYSELQERFDLPLPANHPAKKGRPGNLALRLLDKAVIDHLHLTYKQASEESGGRIREFDTVRAMFPEGEPLYESAGFQEQTHVQVAVRNPNQVLGVFRLPAHQLRRYGIPDLYSS